MTERREIDELVARYELEPTLRDLYVEGPRDQVFLEWLAAEAGLQNVVAYEIDAVNVPDSLPKKLGLIDNHRNRVIALAVELHTQSNLDLRNRVACVADADFARLMDEAYHSELLIWTDFTASEIYLFNAKIVEKYIRLATTRRDLTVTEVLDRIVPVLREMFLARLAAHNLEITLAPLGFDRCCRVRGRTFVFDHDEYFRRYIYRDEHAKRADEFFDAIKDWRKKLSADPRHHIHGHDFIKVLHWTLDKVYRVNGLPSHEDFAATLWATVEFSSFEDTELVAELRRRFVPDN